jgi:hypothetical protein
VCARFPLRRRRQRLPQRWRRQHEPRPRLLPPGAHDDDLGCERCFEHQRHLPSSLVCTFIVHRHAEIGLGTAPGPERPIFNTRSSFTVCSQPITSTSCTRGDHCTARVSNRSAWSLLIYETQRIEHTECLQPGLGAARPLPFLFTSLCFEWASRAARFSSTRAGAEPRRGCEFDRRSQATRVAQMPPLSPSSTSVSCSAACSLPRT